MQATMNVRVEVLKSRLRHQEFRAEKFEGNDMAVQKLTGLDSYALLKAIYVDFLNGSNEAFLNSIAYQHRPDGNYPSRKNNSHHALN